MLKIPGREWMAPFLSLAVAAIFKKLSTQNLYHPVQQVLVAHGNGLHFIKFFTRPDVRTNFGEFLSIFRGSNLGSKTHKYERQQTNSTITMGSLPSRQGLL